MENKLLDGYNPDVLTCLANLSSDEVFTPPKLVNEMLDLLPKDLWSDKNTKFLDPFTKSGVFLREITKRLIQGLEEEIPDLNERVNHILTKQVFGIATTHLTSLISRRSLYCSKTANGKHSICSKFNKDDGNIIFNNIKHTWKNGRCEYCGANQNTYDRTDDLEQHAYEFIHTKKTEEIFNMKFDVIVGNPPYQLSDGGGTGSSAMPLYHKFVEQAKKLQPRYLTMIIPSRWFAGGKGLDSFRDSMLNSPNISTLVDYNNSADCFPGVTIAGGVCYFLWEKDYVGDCNVINKSNDNICYQKQRPLNEFKFFVRNNIAVNIIKKIRSFNESTLDNIVQSRNCFDLDSKFVGSSTKKDNDCEIYTLSGTYYLDRNVINDKKNILDSYKVVMTKAMSGGNKPSSNGDYLVISSTMKVLPPNSACTETYLCIGNFIELLEAENLKNYLKTKFFRFLLLQALSSINISKDKFYFIPVQDFSKSWTDEELYKKYGLTEDEINFIESMIRPMEG